MIYRLLHLAAAILFCAASVFAGGTAAKAADDTEFIAVFNADTCTLHPHTAYTMTEAQIMTALYEGLFVYEPSTLEPLPGYAESWSVSDDKKQWTFTLRRGATFSDGTPVTAAVFIDSWKALLDPAARAPYASMLDFIQGAEQFRAGTGTELGISAPDVYTLQLDLTMPVEYLPKILCHYAFSAVHPRYLGVPLTEPPVVASGPYTLVSYTGDEMKLRKNGAYWDAANVAVPSVTILFSDDSEMASDMFNKGQVHWLESSLDVDRIVQKDAIKLIPSFSTEFFYFRCDTAPWDSAEVRSLLISALPWEEIRSNFLIPAETLIFPLHGYPELEGIANGETVDPESFREALAVAAGCPVEELPELLISIPQAEHLFAIASSMQSVWQSVGLNVRIEQLPVRDYYADQKQSAAAVRMMAWVGDFADPMAFLELFRPTSSLNEARWNNPDFEPLLRRASRQRTQEKRYELLGKAEQLILDDGVIMPISFRPALNAIDDQIVQGWAPNVLDIHPFKFLSFVKRKPVPNLI